MKRISAFFGLSLFLSGLFWCWGGSAVLAANGPSSGSANYARDPKFAVREEYLMARKAGTREALNLFLQRHPDSVYAPRVRRILRGRRP